MDTGDAQRTHWIEEVVKTYQANLRAYLFSRTGDIDVANDIAQDVFLRLVQYRERLDASYSVWPWLMKTARNKLCDYWKLIQKDGAVTGELDSLVAEQQLLREEADDSAADPSHVEALRRCIEKLQPKAAQLIRMLYEEGLSCTQVADSTQKKPGAVYTAAHRVRLWLKSCMESGLEREAS